MRICFLADASSIHTKRWVSYLATRGYEIHLISLRKGTIDNVNSYVIPCVCSMDVSAILNLGYINSLIHSIKPDILHGVFFTSHGFYASLLRFHPFIITALGSDILLGPKKSTRARLKLRYALKKADFITVDADTVKTGLLDAGCPKPKIKKILFGVDSSLLSTPKRDGNSLVLSCRQLKPIYNIDIIIEACRLVNRTFPSSKLVVVGDLSQNPKLLCNDANIEFRPAMPHNKIIDYMTNFDIFVSVPSSDASSVSLLEAMAIGLFPIVSDIPANREWIKNGYNGFLVPPGDIYMLADRIMEALRQPILRKSAVIRINKEIVRERAIFEDNIQKLEEIYRNLVRQ